MLIDATGVAPDIDSAMPEKHVRGVGRSAENQTQHWPAQQETTSVPRHVGLTRNMACFAVLAIHPYKLVFHSPFQEAFVIMASGYLAWTAGREVKKSTGKSLLSQFREMNALWFGQMVDPPTYYAQELFRQERFAKTSQFLTRFETKNGILRSINEYLPSPLAADEMSDKALFARCCAEQRIPHVRTLAVIDQQQVTWNVDPAQLCFDIFCKRQKGKGAIGAEAFRFIAPNQFRDRLGRRFTQEQLISHLRQGSEGRSILVQRWLSNHDHIKDLAQDFADHLQSHHLHE